MFRFPHSDRLFVHGKFTFNMAAWYYAQFNDVTPPNAYSNSINTGHKQDTHY